MRNFFSHWRILLALLAAILLAIYTFRPEPSAAAPPLAERLRQHALGIGSRADYAQAAFAAHGYRVLHIEYGGGGDPVHMLEVGLANLAPGAPAQRVFIVGSRFDAGDNAGAAAVIELAGLLKHLRPAAGTQIRFVLVLSGASHASHPANFIAFIGNRAAAGPVRQALAGFRDDASFLAAGIAAPCYVQAFTHTAADAALLITDTAFARYPLFRADHSVEEAEHEAMARVVSGLARTLAALAGAPSA